MPNALPEGQPLKPVTAENAHGRIQFLRSGLTDAQLDLEYKIPGLRADLRQTSLEDAVAALCETEIAKMRGALEELGEALAEQLMSVAL